jgi:hypothetical protein
LISTTLNSENNEPAIIKTHSLHTSSLKLTFKIKKEHMEPVQVILLTKVKELQGRKQWLQNKRFTMYESGWGRMKWK